MEYGLSGALTDALNFKPKSPGAASRSYRTIVTPLNSGVQNPGDVTKFDIPVGRHNTFIDTSETYFIGQVKNTSATTAFALDGSAYCLINRLDVLSQGQVLESIQNYNVLCNTLLDLQADGMVSATSMSVHAGTGFDSLNAYNTVKTGQTIAASGVQDFALPLALSGVLGPGLNKYLPVSKITDLRLELTMEAVTQAVQASGAASYTIQNPQLVITYVELDPAMAQQIDSATGGHYILSSESWRNYTTILAANRNSDSILIPARYSSVRTMLHTWRDNANATDGTKYWLSARSNPFYSATGVLSSIQYAMGPVLVPQSPIRFGISEAWMQAQQAFHQLGTVSNGSRCTYANWTQASYYDGNAYNMGTFALAQNFDSFLNKSDSLTVGMNTIAVPTFLNVTYPAQVTAAQRLDTFVHFDMVLDISDAGIVARY